MTINVDFQIIPTRDTDYLLIADMSEWDTLLTDPAKIYITKPGTETPFEFDFIKGTDFNMFNSNDFEQPLIVEDEVFTAALDLCVELLYTNFITGTVVVQTIDHLTTYTETTDYEIDYTTGTIKALSTGGMVDLTTYHISYQYLADITTLVDGVYKISLHSENDIYIKTRAYLRTELIRLELDKLIIELDIFNSKIDKAIFGRITDIELLLKSAEANTSLNNTEQANIEYTKAARVLELLNNE